MYACIFLHADANNNNIRTANANIFTLYNNILYDAVCIGESFDLIHLQ